MNIPGRLFSISRKITKGVTLRMRHAYWSVFLAGLGTHTKFWGRVQIGSPHLVSIGDYCTLNRDVMISSRSPVTIGDHVRIAPRVMINGDGIDYSTPREHRGHTSAPVHIRDGAWIGAAAIINQGVTVGEDAVIGAGSIVLQDVPPRTLVFGNPARIVREIP